MMRSFESVHLPRSFTDVAPTKIFEEMSGDDAVFLTVVFPKGDQSAETGEIKEGDTIVVFAAELFILRRVMA